MVGSEEWCRRGPWGPSEAPAQMVRRPGQVGGPLLYEKVGFRTGGQWYSIDGVIDGRISTQLAPPLQLGLCI